jgi:hypothetical protein
MHLSLKGHTQDSWVRSTIKWYAIILLLAALGSVALSQTVPVIPTISVPDAAVLEGNTGATNLIFRLMLSQTSPETVMVDYATRDVSARSGADYSATFGVAVFSPGITNVDVIVSVNGDTWNEPNKTVWLMLTNGVGALLSKSHATGTIENDDPSPVLSISDAVLMAEGAGTVNAVFTVSASGISGQTITVDYETVSGTASAGSEFVPVADTLTFVSGVTRKLVSVPVLGNSSTEPAVFFVNLSDAMNASIARNRAVATLLQNSGTSALAKNESQKNPNIGTANEGLAGAGTSSIPASTKAPIAPALTKVANVESQQAAASVSTILRTPPIAPALASVSQGTDLSFELAASTNFVHVEADLTVILTITNHGSNAANSILLTNWIPDSATLISTKASEGKVIQSKDLVVFDLGTLSGGKEATLSMIMKLRAPGSATNIAQLASMDANVRFTNDLKYLVILATNDLPVISPIGSQFTSQNSPSTPISFMVTDTETSASELILLGSSSDPMLIPDQGLLIGGASSNRTLTIMPALNQTGTAAITVTAIDSDGGETSAQFDMTVSSMEMLRIEHVDALPTTKFEMIEREGNVIKLYFYAEAGLAYGLETTDSLEAGGWQLRTTISPAPITTLVEIIDEANSPQKFYRLSLSNPAGLKLSGSADGSPGRILLHFDAQPDKSYTVEYRDSLASDSWKVLTTISPMSETSTITVCDPDPSEEARFYRVRSP